MVFPKQCRIAVGSAALILSACDLDAPKEAAFPYTLYRNSGLQQSMRIHWATFDADESDPSYNRNNCAMAARLLNANVAASAKAEGKAPYTRVGFWCESGGYKEEGGAPSTLDAAFPTDV